MTYIYQPPLITLYMERKRIKARGAILKCSMIWKQVTVSFDKWPAGNQKQVLK